MLSCDVIIWDDNTPLFIFLKTSLTHTKPIPGLENFAKSHPIYIRHEYSNQKFKNVTVPLDTLLTFFYLFSERPADAAKGTRPDTAGALQGDSQSGLSTLQGGMTTKKEDRRWGAGELLTR